MRLLPVLLVVAAVLSVSGCGDDPRAVDLQPDGPPPRSATSPPNPTSPTSPTTPPSEGRQKVRVVGQVIQDGDCVVVEDDNGTTWTIGGPYAAEATLHARVQVTGAPDLTATGCGGPLIRATTVTVLPVVE